MQTTVARCWGMITLIALIFWESPAWSVSIDVKSTPVDPRYGLLGSVRGKDGAVYTAANDKHPSLDAAPALFSFNSDGSLKWQRVLFPRFTANSRPGVADDGTVYLALSPRFKEGGHDPSALVALSSAGDVMWRLKLDPWYRITQKVQVSPDGVIYVAAFSRKGDDLHRSAILAVNPGGQLRWQYEFAENLTPSGIQTAAVGGSIYVVADNPLDDARHPSRLLIFQETGGDPLVTSTPVGRRYSLLSPVAAPDGSVIVAANHRYSGSPGGVFCFEAAGAQRWFHEFSAKYYVKTPVVVGSDGAIFLPLSIRRPNAEDQPSLLVLNPDGSERWHTEVEAFNEFSTPISLGNGAVYMAATNLIGGTPHRSSVLAINLDGTVRWRQEVGRYLAPSGPVPGASGVVYMSADNPGVENPSVPAQFFRYDETPNP